MKFIITIQNNEFKLNKLLINHRIEIIIKNF